MALTLAATALIVVPTSSAGAATTIAVPVSTADVISVVDQQVTTVPDAQVQVDSSIPGGGRFFDDDGSVHEESIEAIASVGITLGCNPPYRTGYCPDAPVTREQMAAFLVRALGLTDAGGGNDFIDDDASIFEGHIAMLATAGITKGCNPPTNDRFCPYDYVTRGQMAAFLVRALGYTDGGVGDWFSDDDGSVFEPSIDKLAVAGVTAGCNPPTNDRYCPDALVTRAQMATFLARALELNRPVVPERPIETEGTYLNVWGDAGDRGCTHESGERCMLSYDVSGEFFFATGWFAENWSQWSAADQEAFRAYAVRVEASLDGIPLDLYDWGFEVVDDVASKWWSHVFPDWLDGAHTLEVYLIDDDFDYLWTAVVSLRGDGPGYGIESADSLAGQVPISPRGAEPTLRLTEEVGGFRSEVSE